MSEREMSSLLKMLALIFELLTELQIGGGGYQGTEEGSRWQIP